jgi:hypothetical protein
MPTDRSRILQLALEALEQKKREIEKEIASVTGELRSGPAVVIPAAKPAKPARKRAKFSKAERARRAARMKAYWANLKKQKK